MLYDKVDYDVVKQNNTIQIKLKEILSPDIATDIHTKTQHTSSSHKQCYRFQIF